MAATPILTFWAPLLVVIAFIIVAIVTYAYRRRGQSSYKEGSEQTKIFLSGEDEPEAGMRHVRSHNMYWGFFEAMKRYYDPVVRAHTGIVSDYLIWMFALVALVGVALLAAGLF
ncbi:hydrogenase [Chloroflexota bacterium]